MHISQLVKIAHEVAKSKGWWEKGKEKSFGEQIALFHSEISETLEEYRKGHSPHHIYYQLDANNEKKPEGVPIELADVIIRIADTCAYYNIDLEAAIRAKMQYNTKRPYRHGNKTY